MTVKITQSCGLHTMLLIYPLDSISSSSLWWRLFNPRLRDYLLPASMAHLPPSLSSTVRHHRSRNGCWHPASERLERSWQHAVHSPNPSRAPYAYSWQCKPASFNGHSILMSVTRFLSVYIYICMCLLVCLCVFVYLGVPALSCVHVFVLEGEIVSLLKAVSGRLPRRAYNTHRHNQPFVWLVIKHHQQSTRRRYISPCMHNPGIQLVTSSPSECRGRAPISKTLFTNQVSAPQHWTTDKWKKDNVTF